MFATGIPYYLKVGLRFIIYSIIHPSEETIKLIVGDFNKGLSAKDLSQIYQINCRTIIKILNEEGIYKHFKIEEKITSEQWKDVVDRWKQGESQTSIAAHYNIPQTLISKYIIKNGIKGNGKSYNNLEKGKWKGGRYKHQASGYIFIKVYPNEEFSDMADINGYVKEHRLLIAKKIGRSLTKKEQVHHINGIRDDNRIENLQLIYGSHGNGVCLKCGKCGSYDIETTEISK